MNLKKIIIYEFETLFHILNEIKENFCLDIIKVDSQSITDQMKKISSQYVIISKFDQDDFKNHIIIDCFVNRQ